jgi:hypothetical protein
MADNEDEIEHTILVIRDASVYKIPPRARSGGFKSAEWKVADKIWTGFVRVVVVGKRCEIRLLDAKRYDFIFGALVQNPGVVASAYFVTCTVNPRCKPSVFSRKKQGGLTRGENRQTFPFQNVRSFPRIYAQSA